MSTDKLEKTLAKLTAPGRGILAADESTGTIEKRFKAVDIPCNEGTRRDYRETLFSTPGLDQFVATAVFLRVGLAGPVLQAWHGEEKNQDLVQQALLKHARLNGAAYQGRYRPTMEQTPVWR